MLITEADWQNVESWTKFAEYFADHLDELPLTKFPHAFMKLEIEFQVQSILYWRDMEKREALYEAERQRMKKRRDNILLFIVLALFFCSLIFFSSCTEKKTTEPETVYGLYAPIPPKSPVAGEWSAVIAGHSFRLSADSLIDQYSRFETDARMYGGWLWVDARALDQTFRFVGQRQGDIIGGDCIYRVHDVQYEGPAAWILDKRQ